MPSHTARLTAVIALAAIWLLTHRYFGIQHDGQFYAVQALARIDPAAYAHDIFFSFGSQDNYSLFSPIYAWLIGTTGLDRAAFVLLAGAHLAWALATFAWHGNGCAGRRSGSASGCCSRCRATTGRRLKWPMMSCATVKAS
jgi:hypothetical protein